MATIVLPEPVSANGRTQVDDMKALLAAANKAFSGLTINASRSLGDAKRDTSHTLSAAHSSAVSQVVERANLSDVSTGKLDASYIHKQLGLEMAPSDLVVSNDPPRFDELVKVMDVLDGLLAERGIFGPYRDMVTKTKQRLEETRERFSDSQVNIDEMDHEGFHKAAETLRDVVLTSVESVVEKLNEDAAALVKQYHGIIQAQLDSYDAEALSVESASPARMRATRPEDDEDAWQVASQSQELVFESEALQQYVDGEKSNRVIEIYDAEWTQERRRDVARLLPRATRVVDEQDVKQFEDANALLCRLADLSDEKIEKIFATISHSDGEASRYLGALRDSVVLIRDAGEKFQARKRAQRQASERDLAKIAGHIKAEREKDERVKHAFLDKTAKASQWLRANDAAIADRIEKVIQLQTEIAELATQRRGIADQIMEDVIEEEERKSTVAEVLRRCAEYETMLHVSMRNFLLPEGYSGILTDFAVECEDLAKQRFDGHTATLAQLRDEALREANVSRSTAFIAPRLLTFRYLRRVDDLAAKADLARNMRLFCESTKDPYLNQHQTTEQEISQLSSRVAALIPKLQQESDEHRRKYESSVLPRIAEFNVPSAFASIDQLFHDVLANDEALVARASRPPLVTLPLPPPADLKATPALPALVVPRAYYDLQLVDRASKSRNAQKTFA